MERWRVESGEWRDGGDLKMKKDRLTASSRTGLDCSGLLVRYSMHPLPGCSDDRAFSPLIESSLLESWNSLGRSGLTTSAAAAAAVDIDNTIDRPFNESSSSSVVRVSYPSPTYRCHACQSQQFH